MLQITVRQNLQTQKQFLPPRRLTTEQLTHCSIYIYPCTSRTLNFFFALLFYSYCIYSHSALYIFFKLLRPLHCCTVCFVLCYVMYMLCKHIESHFTSPSHIPCLCKLTWPIKPDSDSDSDSDKE